VTKLLYFAWVREKLGIAEEDVTVPDDVATVGQLREWMVTRGPRYAAAFAEAKSVRCAVDQDFAKDGAMIAGAAEIAFFPPVTGG